VVEEKKKTSEDAWSFYFNFKFDSKFVIRRKENKIFQPTADPFKARYKK
jgi:hypothetical protein